MRTAVRCIAVLAFAGLVAACAAFKRGISLSDEERIIIQADYPNGFHVMNIKPDLPAKETAYLTHIYSVLYDYYRIGARVDSLKNKPAGKDAVFPALNDALRELKKAGLIPCRIKDYELADLMILLKNDMPLILKTGLDLPLGMVENQIRKGKLLLVTGYQGFNPDDPGRCQFLYYGYVRQNLFMTQFKEAVEEVIFIAPEYHKLEIVDDIMIQYRELNNLDFNYDINRLKLK